MTFIRTTTLFKLFESESHQIIQLLQYIINYILH